MKKKSIRILQGLLVIFTVLIGSAIFYINDDYDATVEALSYMTSSDRVNVHETSTYVAFQPITETQVATGIIFFQGGKVDHQAYAPMLHQLAAHDIFTFSVISPFRLAMFGLSIPPSIINDYPFISTWIMMGHSLGGVFGATFSYGSDSINGLILLGSYVTQDFSHTDVSILSITASEDHILNQEAFDDSIALMPPSSTIVNIEGGNHSQFGYYGPQQGDGTPSIDVNTQQLTIINTILVWINTNFHG